MDLMPFLLSPKPVGSFDNKGEISVWKDLQISYNVHYTI